MFSVITNIYTKKTKGPSLTLNLLTTTIVAPPSNASKWQMGFNSAFKGLKLNFVTASTTATISSVKKKKQAIYIYIYIYTQHNIEACLCNLCGRVKAIYNIRSVHLLVYNI